MNKYIKISISVTVSIILLIVALTLTNRSKKEKIQNTPVVTARAFSSEAVNIFEQAQNLEAHSDLVGARELYQRILYEYPNESGKLGLQDKIASLNMAILFSRTQTEDSHTYEVVPGDSLERIARKFKTTVGLIKRANNLDSDLIFPGMDLKIQDSSFSIIVDKSQNTLTMVSEGEVLKVYTVSTGKGNSTPVGKFKVVNKLVDPPWYSAKGVIPPDSPDNVLGTRWLGINQPGYGIHGTSDSSSIGYQCTEGCVRMYNEEVEELYSIVPIGTEVTIID